MKLLIPVLAAVMIACGGSAKDADKAAAQTASDTLNERQRDTMLARSRIPGARGVGKAMRVADSTSAGIEQTNAVARDTSEH
jgi:hypothetical protein